MMRRFTVSHLAVVCLGLALFSSTAAAQSFDLPELAFGGAVANSTPYLDWVADYGAEYPRSLFLPSAADPTEGLAMHWRIDNETQRLHIAVAAAAQGWVGLGLAENGGMRGADIVLFEASNPEEVTDAYVLQERLPLVDDCQDWTLTRSFTDNDGFLIFEANRLIDTGDKQDRPLINDALESSVASRIIAAWGDSPSVSYHGTTNRARGQLRWFQTSLKEVISFQDVMMEQAEGYFEHRANNYTVGTNETQYVGFCIGRDDLIAQGVPLNSDPLYLIGFEPLVDPRAKEFVHHFVTTGSDSYSETSTDCAIEGGFNQVYGWAPGEPAYAFPEMVGLPFGDAEGLTGLRMVIHYDNPNGVENILDSSGVRYYYTTQPREHEVGNFVMGDLLLLAAGESVGDGLSTHIFDCPSECSSAVLDEPVTVIRESLHMHQTGISGRIEQVRDGQLVRTGNIDFFDFDQQGNHVIQQPEYQVRPGDSFRVFCEYDSSPDVVFGKASSEEMCLAALTYYPRKKTFNDRLPWVCPYGVPLPLCHSSYNGPQALESEAELGRIFGQSDGVCAVTQEPAMSPTTSFPVAVPTASPIDASTVMPTTASPVASTDKPTIKDEETTTPIEPGIEEDLQVSAAGMSFLGNGLFCFLALAFVRRKLGSERLIVPLLVEF